MMLKHIGKHSSKKIVLVYRQIPDENHMCLILYSDTLPQLLHDEVMTCLESSIGQQAEELADALFRVTMKDGRNCLEALHQQGFLKKVNTNQVIITPNAKSSVRLDELNNILNEMKTGEDAIKRLADLDKNAGMTSRKSEPKEVGANPASRTAAVNPGNTQVNEVLSDENLATQRVAQAAKMKLEANQLLAEAKRLEEEAATFKKASVKNGTTRTKKASPKKQTA